MFESAYECCIVIVVQEAEGACLGGNVDECIRIGVGTEIVRCEFDNFK